MKRKSFHLRLEGSVTEGQELVDGTRHLTMEGAGTDQAGRPWRWRLNLSWGADPDANIEDGELTLYGENLSELYAGLTSGAYDEVEDDSEGEFRASFTVEGGDGPLEGAAGSVTLKGTVAERDVAGEAEVEVEVAD